MSVASSQWVIEDSDAVSISYLFILYHSTVVAGLPELVHAILDGGPLAPEKTISST